MKTSIFIILVLSLSIFGCSDGPNTVLPDGGIFADSDVSPDLSVEDDLGVDSDVPPVDLGIDTAVPDDLGVVEDSAVADLGTLDLGPDASVPPDDLGTPDVGVDSGPVVVDYFPPGENVYYVWVSDNTWNGLEEAEELCASFGGHFPQYIDGISLDDVRVEIEGLLSTGALEANDFTCSYPVERSGWTCDSYCGGPFNPQCLSDCNAEVSGAGCVARQNNVTSIVTFMNTHFALPDGRFYNSSINTFASDGAVFGSNNIVCAIPESGDFSTGISVSPTYTRVLSSYYTTFNAL